MKPLSRIHEILDDLPPESMPESVKASVLSDLRRAQSEYTHLKTKYDRAIQGKSIVHSLLQKSSEEMVGRYRALFEYSGIPMVILNEDGIITLANSHFVEYTGIPYEKIVKKINFFDLIHSADREMAEEYHQARRRHEIIPSQYEIRFQAWFPSCRDVSLNVGLLPGSSESLVSLNDITERKQQKAELSAHNERLEALLTLYQMTGQPESVVTAYATKAGGRLTRSSLGFIAFVEEDREMVTVEAFWSDDSRNENGGTTPQLMQMTVHVDELPFIRQVLESGKPLILNRTPKPRSILTSIVDHPVFIQSALIIPIIDQDKAAAVVCVADKPEDYNLSDQLQLTVLMEGMWRLIIRNRQEDALKTANKKLGLLSSLTRHDVINMLTALEGYIELSKDISGDPEFLSFITKEISVVRSIGDIITFTREYEMVGINAPAWQDVSRIFIEAVSASPLPGVFATSDTEGVWIYADPLLVRVFSNFMDNSVRHGGDKVSTISLSWERTGDDLILIYQDDGIGVPWAEKDKVFIRGYGKHTGLGLFLIREIFAITGITIREVGEPGAGVRFEMTIPRGNFRILGNATGSDHRELIVSEEGTQS